MIFRSKNRCLLIRRLNWEAANFAGGTVRCWEVGEVRPRIKGHQRGRQWD
jgi:hypothetical protein